jgi:hypothetical protein
MYGSEDPDRDPYQNVTNPEHTGRRRGMDTVPGTTFAPPPLAELLGNIVRQMLSMFELIRYFRSRFYEAAVEGRSLRSSGGLQEEEEEESGEEEPEEGKDYSWKKTIMIGPSYQVPVLVTAYQCFGSGIRCSSYPWIRDGKNFGYGSGISIPVSIQKHRNSF